MCFSAQASFVAAGALGAIGVQSVRRIPSRAHLLFAGIPLLFAVQQGVEGLVWLKLNDAPWGKGTPFAMFLFLFFALAVWPAYFALALLVIERNRGRRMAFGVLTIAGMGLGAYLMACTSLRSSDACIAFGNLYYLVPIDTWFKPLAPALYLVLVVAPFFVSSIRHTSLLAVLVGLSFGITGWLYRTGFVSVWCFFAALIGGAVAIVVVRSRSPLRP